jgi:hypothetical protein
MISVDGEEVYKEEVVTFWEAIQRYRQKQSIYRRLESGEGKVLTYLKINNMFYLGLII